ncbi:hypothetical protein SRHO_G00138050 [Serrasalmus rhombeus]
MSYPSQVNAFSAQGKALQSDAGLYLQIKMLVVSEVSLRVLMMGGGMEKGDGWVGRWKKKGAYRQLQYICLALTHVAFDFQCEVQKSFIMTQLLKDVRVGGHVVKLLKECMR